MSGDRPQRERVKTDPMIDRSLVEHESRRPPPDAVTAERMLRENEARRRSSMVDEHERKLAVQEGAFQGFARHVHDVQQGTNAAIVVIARHMGIENKLPPQVRASNRPPPQFGPPPEPKLDAIGKDTKAGTHATYAAVVLAIINTTLLIILELLKRGH